MADQFSYFFLTGGSRRSQPEPGKPAPPIEIDCPSVAVREGASTLAVRTPGEATAMNLRYQGTISRTARECTVADKMVRMKVGVEGRIVLGPAGAPGKIDVPLRFALVREGPHPTTILTKTYRIPVAIEPGATNVPFVQIDDTMTFPLPSDAELEAYVIYVGYDPIAAKPEPRRRKSAPRRKQ